LVRERNTEGELSVSRLAQIISFVFIVASLGDRSWAATSDNPAMDADLIRVGEEWARIKYLVPDKNEQLEQIDKLSNQAAGIARRYPGRAEPLLWEGIVASEEAAMAHLFDRMGYAKTARKLFEQAEAIDPTADNGGVQLSLGVIYYRVPGFPIGFGDDTKARQYLEKALAMDPNGLDTAYFYGDFLIKKAEQRKAQEVLAHGLAAPVTANRPIWDKGRRGEIQALLAKIDKETHR
jgi:tetratricopeptide (TPR) repeat protein